MTPEEIAELAGVNVAGREKADRALAALAGVLVTITNGDRAEGRAALAAVVGSSTQIDEIATLSTVDPGAWASWQMRAEALPGMTRPIAQLRRLVKARAQPVRVARDGEAETYDGPDCVPDGWTAPRGWTVRPDGVWRTVDDNLERVATRPVWVVGYLQDVDGHGYSVRLAWEQVDGGTGQRVVQAAAAADGRALVELANHGLPVTSASGRWLAVYIDAALEANRALLPVEQVASRFGWMPDGGFLLGSEYIGAGGVRLAPDPGVEQIAATYQARGTWQGWLDDVVAPGAASPMLWLALYNAVASVLIEPLELGDNWAIDRSGETSRGKSTVGRAGCSVWSDPRARPSWATSTAGIEARAALQQHLPLSLDDTKKAPRGEDVAQVIYMHSGGVGKLRGKPGAAGRGVGLRVTESWRSSLCSDGEQALTSFSNDAGARARVLVMRGAPLADGEMARRIGLGAEENHGHLGRRVLALLACGGLDKWKSRWAALLAYWSRELAPHGAVAGRLGRVVAALALAREIAEDAGLLAPDCDPIRFAAGCAVSGGHDSDIPAAALRAVYELAVSRPTSFWGRHESHPDDSPRVPVQGWLGRWSKADSWEALDVRPSVVRETLAREGFDLGVLDRWGERGWLSDASGKGRRVKTRVDGAVVGVYRFTRAAIDSLHFDPNGGE